MRFIIHSGNQWKKINETINFFNISLTYERTYPEIYFKIVIMGFGFAIGLEK